MAQPVRKRIKEQHPDMVHKESIYTLLVDGTNLLKVSFADPKVNTRGEHYGGVFQFLLQLHMMMKKKSFDYVYVFFDDEDSGILRYEIYHDYKANRDKNYASHVQNTGPMSDYMKEYEERLKGMKAYLYGKNAEEKMKKNDHELTQKEIEDLNFQRERTMLMEYFNELYIRWMMDDITEADDLIAYYVQHKKPEEKVVIMSTDEDLTQLIKPDVCIYNKLIKKFITLDNFKDIKGYHQSNVVAKKILIGDKSDNIGNIEGLSEKRLMEIIPEIAERPITIQEVIDRAKVLTEERVRNKKKPLKWQQNIINGHSAKGYEGDFYEINRKLIDLSHPLLTEDAEEELKNMMYAPQDPEGRSLRNLYSMVYRDDLTELRSDSSFTSFFEPFNSLINKEQKRYKEEIGK